jgi:hypothetical protein
LTKTQSDQQTTIAPLAVSIVTPIESDVFDTIPAAAQPSPGADGGLSASGSDRRTGVGNQAKRIYALADDPRTKI